MLTFEGLPRKLITALGGATSAGKSALGLACVLGATDAGHGALCVSLEDEAVATVKRALAIRSGINNTALQRGIVGPNERGPLNRVISELGSRNCWFLPRRIRKAEDIASAVRRHCREYPTGLVVIDFLQLVGVKKQTKSNQERVDAVLEIFVDLLDDIDAAVLLLSQLVRTYTNAPTKEDLYWSGAIEQWSHTIGLLWRAPVEIAGCVGLIVDKQKNGPTGRIELGWDANLCSFRDPDPVTARSYAAAVAALESSGGRGKRSSRGSA
jgi:replicative DNA helicase